MTDKEQKHLTDFGFKKVPEEEKAEHVKEVFNEVAPRYDLMNDILSFGLHRMWKHAAIHKADIKENMKVLDIAGGTGDISLLIEKKIGPSGEVWLTDINLEMLKIGERRLREAGYVPYVVECDAEALPCPSNYFDVVIVSYGLRNMTHKDRALAEMLRVCKPGGKVIVLEFSKPAAWMKPFYDFYSFHVMPFLASKIAGNAENYRYLAESIRMHPDQQTLAKIMSSVGFSKVEWENFTFGITPLHIGYKN